MKAITLTQPWATLVAIGAKKIETRSWYTSHRGPLAIHAGKGLAGMGLKEFAWLCTRSEHIAPALRKGGYTLASQLPRGVVVATCELVDCLQTGAVDVDIREEAFGDYRPGRWAWLLENVQALPEPIPVRGALGLWEVTL